MANTVTRCPKCDTSFRITEAHLNSAKGAVRCGSCLHIFNARDYLANELDAELDPKKTTPKKPPQSDDDDVLINDDMDEDSGIYSEDMDSNVILASTFGPSDSNLFERDPSADEDDDESIDPDESWAMSLLEDDEPEEPVKITRNPAPAKRELFKAKDTHRGAEGNFYGKEPPAPPGSKISKDHFKIIDELRNSDEEYDPISHRGSKTRQESPEDDYEEDDAYNEEEYAEDGQEDDGVDYVRTNYEAMEYSEHEFEPEIGDIDEIDDYAYRDQYGTTSNSRYIHSIEPEPVEFSLRSRYPIWHSRGLWTGLACAGAVLLLIQLAIFRFDDLSTVEPWRSYYAKACSIFTCELPQLRDRSKIKASNLVVRSHPTIDNSLMVDAILRNTARFPQTFPPLDLVFTDIKNKPVAARRFEASEYLGGELAGKNAMPVNQPIHIAIEISDPGATAVSYFITIPD